MTESIKIKNYHTKEERLADYAGEDRVVSSEDLAKELESTKDNSVYNYKAGIPKLDFLTEGFEAGELEIISGYTGFGKTSLCQTFTVAFEKAGIKTLWFSYEMPARQFLSKFPGLPIFYMPRQMKEKALTWIEDRIMEAKVKYGVRAIMIDHLHFLIDLIKMRQPSLEIGTIVRSLKQLAMKHNVVIFLIAHTSMPKGNQIPGLDSIRDSSFVTQEADLVMVIQRILDPASGIYGNESWINILKNRRTGTIGKKIKVIYKDKLFQDPSEEILKEDPIEVPLNVDTP